MAFQSDKTVGGLAAGGFPERDQPESSRALVLPGALVVWTLFVWVGRLRNIFGDDELTGFSQLWRALLAASFVALAGVSAVLLLRMLVGKAGEPSKQKSLLRRWVRVLALYGIVVWSVRGIDIALGVHPVAFKLVHSVLAIVTISLGLAVLRRFVSQHFS